MTADRGRVPFALIGIVLLLGSTAFSTTLSTRGVVDEDRDVDVVVEHVRASTASALRAAVVDAAREAGREPVTRPADTPFGRALDRKSAFRDALRIRIYVTARRYLRTSGYRRGDVHGRAALQSTPSPGALAAAMRRVRLDPVRNGTAVSVTLADVNVTVVDGDRSVVDRNRTFEATVSTPVFALWNRSRRFERRLNRGPIEGPGLGRRLTARLYPVAWARGYAQYYGAPIDNVVTNRHVSVTTNGAVLGVQRASFGRTDPDGRRGMRRALAHLGLRDVTAPLGTDGTWTRRILARPNRADSGQSIPSYETSDAPRPSDRIPVRTGVTATRAFGRFVGNASNRSTLETAIRSGYRARVRLRTATEIVEQEPRPPPSPPTVGADLIGTEVETAASVTNASAPVPTAVGRERTLATFERRVRLDRTAVRRWSDGGSTRATWSETRLVGVALVGRPDPTAAGPNRSVSPAFRPGGPLDGPNLADVPGKARRALIVERGGADAVAAAAASGRLDRRRTTVVGDRPDGIVDYVYTGVAALRERIRNVSVRPRRGTVGTGRSNPPAMLAGRIRDHRSDLLDAPDGYDGAAGRTRTVARALYLQRVVERLERRAERRRERLSGLDDRLRSESGASLDDAHDALGARRNVTTPPRGTTVAGAVGAVRTVPDGSPAYLTLSSVDRRRVSAVPAGQSYRPLAARNTNLFAVPYGDAVDAVTGSTGGGKEGDDSLRAAGRTLVAAGRLTDRDEQPTLGDRRRRLDDATERALAAVRSRAEGVLDRRTDLGPGTRQTAVRSGFERWPATGRRALAVVNGSAAAAVADEAIERLGSADEIRRDRIRTGLETAIADEAARTSVDGTLTEETVAAVRGAATTGLQTRAGGPARERPGSKAETQRKRSGSRGRSRKSTGPFAGLPVEPTPGHWYLTVNVWTVTVRGAYARFVVETRRGPPGRPLRYVRDGSWVEVDVDGDGSPERLGRDERLAFETTTTVVVAVPPGRRGVGDRGGNADERSGGWPWPACPGSDADGCGRPG